MKKEIFTGSGVAIITPMHKDGSVNFAQLEKLIEFQIENGTDAIISCGTTGESATLSHEEHCQVLQFTIDKVNGRIPVIAGTGSNDTAYAVLLSKEAEKMGADALLVVTPYYNKASQEGLVKHYFTVADSVSLPIILYNIPSRTGCLIKPETYVQLIQHPNIVATKEATGDISHIAKVIALCGNRLTVYSGNDDQTLPIMALGGKGVISVIANICPQLSHDMCATYLQGDSETARKLFLENLELMNTMFIDVNPIAIKEAANLMGFDCGSCRLPLCDLNEQNKAKLTAVMQQYGLIEKT